MQKILASHAPVLKRIQLKIEQEFKIPSDKIKPVNFSISDGGVMTFQLSFQYPIVGVLEEILLDFEIRENSPSTLYFEALNGLKGYESSNEYHGLENEIVKYISIKIDD
ncbi:MAG: hypothetical protein HQ556_13615 [Candidatus Marinimicrobia bacterium]|nr:hypothetical protein [Candidatus Neomarinimicrobiota bacterium]